MTVVILLARSDDLMSRSLKRSTKSCIVAADSELSAESRLLMAAASMAATITARMPWGSTSTTKRGTSVSALPLSATAACSSGRWTKAPPMAMPKAR